MGAEPEFKSQPNQRGISRQAVCQLEAVGPGHGPGEDEQLKAVLGPAPGPRLYLPLKYAEKTSETSREAKIPGNGKE